MFVVSAAEQTLSPTVPMPHALPQAGKQRAEHHAHKAMLAVFQSSPTRPVNWPMGLAIA